MSWRAEDFSLLNVGTGGQGVVSASNILAWAALRDDYNVRTAETHGMAQRGGSVASYVRFGTEVYGPLIPRGTVDVILAFELSEALRNVDFASKKTTFIISDNMQIPPTVLTSRNIEINADLCNGCGVCFANCVPNFVSTRHDKPLSFVPSGPRKVVGGERVTVPFCTGCGQCTQLTVCPREVLSIKEQYHYPTVEEVREALTQVTSEVYIVPALHKAIEAGNAQTVNILMLGVLFGSGKLPLQLETLRQTIYQFVPPKALEVNKQAFEVGLQMGQEVVIG
jgi:Pyruvate/2-oxoacid:ferredoxin oxidoreductase gamma subunit